MFWGRSSGLWGRSSGLWGHSTEEVSSRVPPFKMPISKIRDVYSVQFSHSVVSDSLWPHGLQHARPPCPAPTPGAYSNSCLLSRWCHSAICSSVVPFSRLQSSPASESFPMSWLLASGSQSIGASAQPSVLSVIIKGWFPLGWTGWLDLLAVQGTLKSLLQHHSSEAYCLFILFMGFEKRYK